MRKFGIAAGESLAKVMCPCNPVGSRGRPDYCCHKVSLAASGDWKLWSLSQHRDGFQSTASGAIVIILPTVGD